MEATFLLYTLGRWSLYLTILYVTGYGIGRKICDQLKLEIESSLYNMAFLRLHNNALLDDISALQYKILRFDWSIKRFKAKKKLYHIFCNIMQLYYLFIINIHMYTWSLKEAVVINLDNTRFGWKNFSILSNKAANLNYLSILILLNWNISCYLYLT